MTSRCKIALLLGAAAVTLMMRNICAQGTGTGVLNFNTIGVSQDKRIYGCEGAAAGPNYQVALYAGPQGTFEGALVQVGPSVGLLSGVAAGTFFGGARTITGLPVNGAVVTLQARAWCSAGGIFPTYESALLGMSPAARGPIFDFKTKDPTDSNEPIPTIGQSPLWRGFAMAPLGESCVCVPEPSTIALAVCGGAVFILLSRSRRPRPL